MLEKKTFSAASSVDTTSIFLPGGIFFHFRPFSESLSTDQHSQTANIHDECQFFRTHQRYLAGGKTVAEHVWPVSMISCSFTITMLFLQTISEKCFCSEKSKKAKRSLTSMLCAPSERLGGSCSASSHPRWESVVVIAFSCQMCA